MKAVVNDGTNKHYINEVDSVNERIEDLAIFGIAYYSWKDIGQDVCSKWVHSDVNSEKEERRSKVSQWVHQSQVENLNVQAYLISNLLFMMI